MSRGRRSTRDISIKDIRRSGRWFCWEGLHFGASDLQLCQDDFAWQVKHFVWPGLAFSWQAQCFREMGWKKVRGCQLSTQLSSFEGSLAELLRFWCWQRCFLEDVLQNCCVCNVVNFQIERSLTELLPSKPVNIHFKSRIIASFQIERWIDR